MSTTIPNNPNKPFTANFELETKIRIIIQEVLAATIRKYTIYLLTQPIYRLSLFNEKIDKFDNYFISYKENIDQLDHSCKETKQSVELAFNERAKLKKDFAEQVILYVYPPLEIIKHEETEENLKLELNETKNEVKEMSKNIKQIIRQNESLNAELSKTKSKFLEYSNVISGLKEEVSWKITKYIEETAKTNTEIKINNEEMKKEYFNVCLMLEKQKERYDKIIETNEITSNNTKQIMESVDMLRVENDLRISENHRTLEKLDEYDTFIQSKIKTVEGKIDVRICSLETDNEKSMKAAKKLETFNNQLEEIKSEQEKVRLQTIRKIEDIGRKTKEENIMEIVKVSKEVLKVEKSLMKKLSELSEANQKSEDFLTQKIEFIKMELESELSSQTNKIIQQKEQEKEQYKESTSKVNSSTMDEINTKINKINLDFHKQLTKVENSIKEVKSELKKSISESQEVIESRMENIPYSKGSGRGRGNSNSNNNNDFDDNPNINLENNECIKQLQEEQKQQQNKLEQLTNKLKELENNINQTKQEHTTEITNIHTNQQNQENSTKEFQTEITKNLDTNFKKLEIDITKKVEKIMFLITKMRGDGIIRNEFTDKEIKEVKKNHNVYKEYTETILKLVPAFGECINLIMALIYDAEFQHSKIIQDCLPTEKKEEEKFNTCLEGILYEFKEKKKSGVICYRHKELKKTEIVKATFLGYIRVWEDLFENEYKDKAYLLPKGFYKRSVEKAFISGKNNIKVVVTDGYEQQQHQIEGGGGISGATSPIKREQSPNKRSTGENYLNPTTNSFFYENLSGSSGSIIKDTQSQRKDLPKTLNSFNNSIKRNESKEITTNTNLKQIEENESIEENIKSNQGMVNNQIVEKEKPTDGMNASFTIRKKKSLRKDEVLVINIPSQ